MALRMWNSEFETWKFNFEFELFCLEFEFIIWNWNFVMEFNFEIVEWLDVLCLLVEPKLRCWLDTVQCTLLYLGCPIRSQYLTFIILVSDWLIGTNAGF